MSRFIQSIAVGCLFSISFATAKCPGVCGGIVDLDKKYFDNKINGSLLDNPVFQGKMWTCIDLEKFYTPDDGDCIDDRDIYVLAACGCRCFICEDETMLKESEIVEKDLTCGNVEMLAQNLDPSQCQKLTKEESEKCCGSMNRMGDGGASCTGICPDGTPLPDPEEMVDFMGTTYTCQDLEDMAKANETVCQDIASDKSIANDCACPDNDGCSVCPNNASLPDPDLLILGIDGYTCGDVAALDFISNDICDSFEKSYSYVCGCPDAKEPECSACPEGGVITNPSGDLSELGLPVTCKFADDYAKIRCSGDPDENKRVQEVFKTVCGCAVPEPTVPPESSKNELEPWAKAVISVIGSIAFLAAMACLVFEYRKPIA